jgi:cell division protein FtsB
MLDALFGERGLSETMRARRAYEATEMALGRMKQENAELRDEARRLRDDPGAIESVAREDLGMIKRGEILVVIKNVK